jgi:ethanolamine ammonia-lyase small subunit
VSGDDLVGPDAWRSLRRFTPARVALGRIGDSLPTEAWLEFSLAHAQARDAVLVPLQVASMLEALDAAGFATLAIRSAAMDRAQYLRLPDAGRRLDESSVQTLRTQSAAGPGSLCVVVADGLSATAVHRHALPLLEVLRSTLPARFWTPIVVAQHARVALGDQIGALLGAEQVAVLIGERPGLSSPDSLGIYFTHAPLIGRTDAERNCISNIRPAGLGYTEAASRLVFLLEGACRLGCSGVALRDRGDSRALTRVT